MDGAGYCMMSTPERCVSDVTQAWLRRDRWPDRAAADRRRAFDALCTIDDRCGFAHRDAVRRASSAALAAITTAYEVLPILRLDNVTAYAYNLIVAALVEAGAFSPVDVLVWLLMTRRGAVREPA
jgi:hypothetical protein